MVDKITQRVEALDGDEEGAVLMLMLAGVLICFMTALVVYDAGVASHDKMSTQVAADTSAFSASVVKARTMNMVSVANTNKRVLYGVATTYNAAFGGLILAGAAFAAQCFPGLSPRGCINAARAAVQITMETIEFGATNLWHLTKTTRSEVAALDKYQEYMIAITPWWAWVEGAMRARVNNATFAATWPPPGDASSAIDKVRNVAPGLSAVLSSSSGAIDALPLKRRDQIDGFGLASLSYCFQYSISLDHLMTYAEHFMKSNGRLVVNQTAEAIAGYAVSLITLVPCYAAFGMLSDKVFDYQIDSGPGDEWLRDTGSISFAYKAKAGRNSASGARRKYNYMEQDYNAGVRALTSNEGQFALASSEIVYKDQGIFGTGLNFPGVPSPPSSGSGSAPPSGGTPEMWNPSWTARLRPVALPGEGFGNTSSGDPVGIANMAIDVLPYIALAGAIGLLDDDVSITSLIQDMLTFALSSRDFTGEHMEGIVK